MPPAREAAVPRALVEPQEMAGGHGRTHHPHHAGRVVLELGRAVLVRGQANPALDFTALDKGGDEGASVRPFGFGQGQNGWQGRRSGVGWRAPHRLVVEHVHGHPVDRCGRHRRGFETRAKHARNRRPAQAFHMCGGNPGPLFQGAGHGHGKPVQHDPLGNRHDSCRQALKAGLTERMTQLLGDGHVFSRAFPF